MQAGGAVAAAAGRAALWAVSTYMQQPLRNTAVAALIGLSAMASSNILYHQSHHHPAPLFGSFSAAPANAAKAKRAPAPVMPAQRPRQLETVDSSDTTGSIDPKATLPKLIGNDDVTAVQRQLASLSLFDGTVDGMYGPRTANSIRAFEAKLGRPVRGQLTPDIVALITSTKALPAPAQMAPATPSPVVAAQAAPALVEENPLPAPAPLLKTTTQPAESTQTNDPEDTPVAEIAPIDTTPAVETLPMVTSKGTVVKRQVQTIAVRVQPAPDQPMPSAIAPAADVPPATEGADASTDKSIVATVQRGLNSLGFLHGEISGIADEATSKAVRNFEVYYNYDVTGKISKGLVNLLQQAGAVI
jgi:peptidoglycan hydrolase-like protein with peptidoglycan-binding domain